MSKESDPHSSDYFDSYTDLEVHKVMLTDKPRNLAYRNAIFSNKPMFDGKTVLDVGAGTGFLSVMCAQAGAKKVYAVEATNVANIAKRIVEENEVESIVEVIEGKIEDVSLPDKVDVIISEWMGFYLLHEAMLDSVLYARDKYLATDGVMFPHKCALYAAPCAVPDYYDGWENVCGVRMHHMAECLRKRTNEPRITNIAANWLLADGVRLVEFDLRTVTVPELETVRCPLFAVANRTAMYQGLCIWFDVTFPTSSDLTIILSTCPTSTPTHWKQTVLMLPHEVDVEVQEPIAGTLTLTKDAKWPRRYNIEYTMLSADDIDHPIPCDCYFTTCIVTKEMTRRYDSLSDSDELNSDESNSEESNSDELKSDDLNSDESNSNESDSDEHTT